MEIALKDIKLDYNPRTNFEGIDTLAESIKDLGLLQPLIVARKNEGYVLLDGARRYMALTKLKVEKVEAVVRDLQAAEQKEVAVATDFFKDKLKPGEKAVAIYTLISKEKKYTPKSLSERYGLSVKLVNAFLKVAVLHADVLGLLNRGEIEFQDALDLTQVSRQDMQIKFAGLIADKSFHGLSAVLFNSGLVYPLEFDDIFTYEEAKKDGKIGIVFKDNFGEEFVFCYDKDYYDRKIKEYQERTHKNYDAAMGRLEESKLKQADSEKNKDKEKALRKKHKEKFHDTLPVYKDAIEKYIAKEPAPAVIEKLIEIYCRRISADNCRLILKAFGVDFKSSETTGEEIKKLTARLFTGLVITPEQAIKLIFLADQELPKLYKVSMFSPIDEWQAIISRLNG